MREAELYELLDGAADAAFVVDQGGLIRFWNHSAEVLLGAPCADVLNRPCATTIDGLDSAGSRLCVADCVVLQMSQRSTRIPAYDLEVNTVSGSRKWVNVSIVVAHAGPERERLLIHLLRDIDTRKRLENLTKEIAESVGRLTGQQAEELVAPARSPTPSVELTTRERRILQLLSLGHGTKAIAAELDVAPITVRNHIQHILIKLAAHTRLEAVMRAVRERLI